MKTRQGFVSNSSSSSFVAVKSRLSELQLELIRKHRFFAGEEAWYITEDDDFIKGKTCMDNFDMSDYLETIGVAAQFGY
jgi:hypothetical protein